MFDKRKPRNPHGSVYKRVEKRITLRGKESTQVVWYARKRYKNLEGKLCEKKRRADTHADALAELENIKAEIEKELKIEKDSPNKTFDDLIAYYKAHYLKPAKYIHDRKVSGLRSYDTVIYSLQPLETFFADRLIRTISYDDLRRFREQRLNTRTQHGKERSIAAVNRELALLRRMLNVALKKDWIERNPFSQGDSLISAADERERMRVLTREEANKLLEKCGITNRSGHLRPLVMAALDTAMRQGELFSLRWSDIDFEKRIIKLKSINTKTQQPRIAPLTKRLITELKKWREIREQQNLIKTPHSRLQTPDLVFGVRSTVQQSFQKAVTDAGLSDVRFHDLRHTAITWMLESGMSPAKVMKISGHTQYKTFLRYVNLSEETAQAAADALDKYHAA